MDELSTAPVDDFLRALADRDGSDVLLIADSPAMLRVAGDLEPYGEDVLTPDRLRALVQAMLPTRLVERLDEDREVDFSFTWGERLRVRGHAFHQRGTVAV